LIVANETKLQQFLVWSQQKADFVEIQYEKPSLRAYYCYIALALTFKLSLNRARVRDRARNLTFTLVPTLAHTLTLDSALALALAPALALALTDEITSKQNHARTHNLFLYLIRSLSYSKDSELKQHLQKLQDRLPDQNNYRQFDQWWRYNGKQWTEDLKQVMIKYRNIGHDWQFTTEQEQKLQQYYDANLLLAQCLKSECYLSREVREEIEETMLLPVAEIERWKRENGR
jgi:hypothetical protein